MTLLYIFPHPDDESFGPAPAIARQIREGHDVHLLTLTKGGATKQRHALGLSVEEMGDVREKEMHCVARTLGLADLTILDMPDGGMKHLDPLAIAEAIEERIRAVRPQVIVTYAVHGISGHPDHLVSHAVVKDLFCRLRQRGDEAAPARLALFTIAEDQKEGAPEHLKTSPAGDIGARVSFSPEDRAAAEAALACYETYRAVVEAHRPLDTVASGVAFELFGEEPRAAPLADITAGL